MPAVAALPRPDVKKSAGGKRYGGPMDAQMRNAIYGYVAESDKQAKAAYMRGVRHAGHGPTAAPPRLRFRAGRTHSTVHARRSAVITATG